MNGWDRFIAQLKKDLKLWLFFMLVLSGFRAAFILVFRTRMAVSTGTSDVLLTLLQGMRFDAMVASFWALIPFLAGVLHATVAVLPIDRIRAAFGRSFLVLTTILAIITTIYFREYNDHFNHFVFNLYYDDTKAIFSTIWSAYHPVPNIIAMLLVSYGLIKAFDTYRHGAFFRHDPASDRDFPLLIKTAVVLLIVIALAAGLRGSVGHRPTKLEDAAITRDAFLNKAVLTPYHALLYAYTTHRRLAGTGTGLAHFLPDGDVRKAARELFQENDPSADLDGYLRRVAPGPRNAPPRHIFLVVMESYDAWPLMKRYRPLGLTPELTAIAEKGIHIVDFLPASDGTATSLAAIVTGLPDADVVTNYQKNSEHPYPSSLAAEFKRLGYRTRFFYGGYLSWQRIGDFMTAQGFEEVYGGGSIGSLTSHNEWGVEDEGLFSFIERTVAGTAGVPSFNVVMTTSYHPPYDLDVASKGFKLAGIPAEMRPQFDGTTSLKMLGHLWYSDQCIGAFVRNAEKLLPRPLFAFTGDHFGRKFINDHPDFFEGSAVPFILYGREVLAGTKLPPDAAGSHIDIGPTLVELAAPRGFVYYAAGSSVLDNRSDPLGVARGKIVGPHFLFDVTRSTFHPLPDTPLPGKLPDPAALKLLHDRLHGIAWWRIMRGPEFPLSR